MLQCYSHNSSHPCLLPQSPNTCSLYLCLIGYLTYRYFDDDYSDCSKAIPHCSFDCISQIMSHVEQPFMSSVAIVCLLWRNVCLVLLSTFLLGYFFFLVLCYMSCLYVSETNPLSAASFAIIFSHSSVCLFFLFIVSFTEQKNLNLIKSTLFIFIFISLGGGSYRNLL